MKILQVITSLSTGGAEKLVSELAPMLRDKGNQVDVCVFDGAETDFKQELVDKGIKVYSFGKHCNVYNPLFIFKLLKLMRNYDIVHTHNTAPQLFAAIGSVLCSVVLCTTEHTTSNRRRGLKWYVPIDKWMYSRYSKVISISDATTVALKKYVDIKSPVVTISNGIDLKEFSTAYAVSKSELGCREGAFLLMMVAGFRYQKDQDTIIRAMRLLPENVQLCLVGDGVRKTQCESLAKSLGVADKVVFTGIRSDVPNVLKAADVVVMSSHYEGFGLAAVEGMAAGKPVVASDVAGLGDIVRNYGLLFPHSNYKALAAIIKKLSDDKENYKQVADKCWERAQMFDIQKMVDAYSDVYNELYAFSH